MNAVILFSIRNANYSLGLGSSRQDFMEIEGVEHHLLLTWECCVCLNFIQYLYTTDVFGICTHPVCQYRILWSFFKCRILYKQL